LIRYVFDTGALIAAERRKARATGLLDLVARGTAQVLVPLPVVADPHYHSPDEHHVGPTGGGEHR
jgi:hypothetical protein